jgi:hypothetical protein
VQFIEALTISKDGTLIGLTYGNGVILVDAQNVE